MQHLSFKILGLTLAFSTAFVAHAGTISVGVSNSGGTNQDTCPGCDYIVNQAFGASGYKVVSYNFIAGQTGNITPLLLTRTDSGDDAMFTVVGVGATHSNVAAGPHNFLFDLVHGGVDTTTANTYFGFASSSPLVDFQYSTANGGVFFSNPEVTTVGQSFDGGETSIYRTNQLGGVNARTYSIEAVASTPEPSSLALLGTGLAGLGGLVKRRFKRA